MFVHALRIILIYLFLLPSAWAVNSLALVIGETSAPYREFAATFSEALQQSNWRIAAAGKIESIEAGSAPDVLIALGADAFRQILARAGNTPVIATFISRTMYEKILVEAGPGRGRTSAIFIEQPIARQVAFLRQLLPGYNRIGMLTSRENRAALLPFRQSLLANGLSFDSEESDGDESLLPAVNALLPRVSLLLATPDQAIYKRDNIKTILLTSYRHQKPVIAFSAAFVNAGALAAVYSTPQQIARQTADLLVAHGSALFSPEYPQLFSVAINRSVADALNLSLANEAELRRALMQAKELK
jgi:ABC-type uncharacterized transport system substrate-binding protein